MKTWLLALAALIFAGAPVHGEPGWLDLPENEARAWIIEHALHQADSTRCLI